MASWTQGRLVRRHPWNKEVFSLFIEAPVESFSAGQFVRLALDIEGERVARPYSIISAPDAEHLEILFNIVPEGPLSGRLAALEPGDPLWVTREAAGLFTLDEVPDVPDLWLMATGTGVGPYLSMLRADQVWRRFERILLVHAVRLAADLVHRELIGDLRARYPDRFHYVPVISREQAAFGLHGRIPALIEGGELEARAGAGLDAARSHVMLCGNQAMIRDTIEVLGRRGLRRHLRREPGHITTEKYH